MPLLSQDADEFEHVLSVCGSLTRALLMGPTRKIRIHTRDGSELVGYFLEQSFFTARSATQACAVGGELTVMCRNRRKVYDFLDILRITPVI